MRRGMLAALAAAALAPGGAGAYSFPIRQLTFDGTIKNSITMRGALAGWISCAPDPVNDFDPASCEVWVYDANGRSGAHPITRDAVEEQCVGIDGRDVVFWRNVGAGEVVLRDLDAGETVLSSAGIDAAFYACPQISATRVVWLRGGQVVVYDRAHGTERVVGANASYPSLSGDFVVWQEGVDAASEVWFLDARDAGNSPQRLTDDAVSDERPTVAAIRSLLPLGSATPSVAWYRFEGGHYEIRAWNGSAVVPVTNASSLNQYFPQITAKASGTLLLEAPAIAWVTTPLEVFYCTTCDGDPANVLALPASDPFLAGSSFTTLDAIEGGWLVFQRILTSPASQFDIGFFEMDGAVVTPITDDPELDDVANIGFRSAAPSGPVVVWRRLVDGNSQIFRAPEPTGAATAALGATALIGWRRRRRPR